MSTAASKASEQLAEAERQKLSATQEAAYYRAKLAAVEGALASGSPEEVRFKAEECAESHCLLGAET